MVAEILQYFADGIRIRNIEADSLYAGIMIDTNNFLTKTGVRTFEAAAFLRRCGADVTRVRKMFREHVEDYRAKGEAIRNAELFREHFAISVCPSEGLDSPTVIGAQAANELLNIEEIKTLIRTPCKNAAVKKAFLFACFCGLRVSDIKTLKWSDIRKETDGICISKKMIKTKQVVTIPLSENALAWMPSKGNAKLDDLVFCLPSYFTINYQIKQWAKEAGLEKNITFHVARHTFATALLTMGADLYTTSKLLGHQNIKTTQVYAEVVNKKKVETVNLLDKIGTELGTSSAKI